MPCVHARVSKFLSLERCTQRPKSLRRRRRRKTCIRRVRYKQPIKKLEQCTRQRRLRHRQAIQACAPLDKAEDAAGGGGRSGRQEARRRRGAKGGSSANAETATKARWKGEAA